ncbi:MAG: prefoldin subunit alpha [Promethearchaeota archaeon]|nr:MAG: prefoldin subunit alpha [Candidatus Lokiarchaeota archaeon]
MENMQGGQGGQGGQAQLQQLAREFNYLRESKQMYEQNLDLMDASLKNLSVTKETIQNLDQLKEGEEILLPVGGLIYVKANIKDPNKILLSVADDTVVEKTIEGSIEFIDKLIQQHREQVNFLNTQVQQIEARLQYISQIFQQGMGQQPQM